ncbi:MAG: ligand-binding sensor domain-containing protein [Patiriisocius sp.]|jgi:ligand-binding sensor domain-containing protein
MDLVAPPQIAEFIVEIFEDKKGGLWFGTMGKGAAHNDGKKLSYFSAKDGLLGNTVASITQDHEGNMWFGTHSGATKYDGKSCVNYSNKDGLTGLGSKILVDKRGNIWAGTNDGLFRFDGKAFSKVNIPNPAIENPSHHWVPGKVWSLIEDSAGNLWFGRDGLGACKYDGKSFTHFTKKDGLCSNNVNSIIEDSRGNIWFTAIPSSSPEEIKEGGVCSYDGTNFTQYHEIEGLNEKSFYSICEDKTGNIWIGAAGSGVYRYDGTKFTLFNETNRMDLIPSFSVQSILEDGKGRIWFGFSGGLFRFNGSTIINVNQEGPWY